MISIIKFFPNGWQNFCEVWHKIIFMKKKFLSFAICLSAAFIWSCNNSTSDTATSGDTTSTASSGDTAGNMATNTPNNSTVSSTPLSKDDSNFVMEAAKGGMMEVQAGQLAQQNAQSQRVKDFGGMMVTDHTKANDELRSYASGHGITLPDSLPSSEMKHMNAMKSMKGNAFDKHYVSMMVEDHQKDVAKFKKASQNCNDAQLKTWASNTLPTLQKHLDSIQAIKKGM
jgi:putative membrane protein